MMRANVSFILGLGFTKHSLSPEPIFVEGYRAKGGDYRANGGSITFEDTKKLFLGSSHDEPLDTQQK